MSHTTVVDDVLLGLAIVLALLLAVFIGAVIRAPAQPATEPAQAGPAPGAAEPAPAPKLPVRKPAASGARPPASASPARAHGPGGYLPKHGVRGGPPWGPAPRPPGIGRLPRRCPGRAATTGGHLGCMEEARSGEPARRGRPYPAAGSWPVAVVQPASRRDGAAAAGPR